MSVSFMAQRALFVAGIGLIVWLAASFLYYPMIAALQQAFFSGGQLTGKAISDLLASNRVRQALINTGYVTLATVITVNIVGVFQVMVIEYFKIRGEILFKIAFATPLVFGSVVAAAGYKFAYGQSGALTRGLQFFFPELDNNWFEGWLAVLYAHTFLMTSFHYLFLRAAVRRIDYSIVEAARSLGASNATIFFRIILPMLLPTIFAATLLVTYTSLGSFAVPAVLGGRDFFMINQIILTLNSIRRQDMAALLALLLGVLVLLCILAFQAIEARGSYVGGAKTPVRMQKVAIRRRLTNGITHALAYALVFVYLAPVVLTFLFSFATTKSIVTEVIPTSLTLENYAHVFSSSGAFTPFANSITMGLVAVGAGLGISLFTVSLIHRHRNWATRLLDLSFFIPWVLPMALLAIGLISAFDEPSLLLLGQVLLGSYWILPIGYAIFVLPLMIRFLRAAFWGLDPALDDAARSLGAPPLYRFRRITLPLIAPVVVLVGAITFNDVLSEYTLSAFLYNVNNRPLSIALLEGARSPEPEQTAINLVYIALIMAFSFIIIMSADRFGIGRSTGRPA